MKSNKTFTEQFPTQQRENLCGEPIAQENDMLQVCSNVPSQHFWSKIMAFAKELNYEIRSMHRTASGLNLFQEKKLANLKKKAAQKKKEKKENQHLCIHCKKKYASAATLYTHVNKTGDCRRYYAGRRLLGSLAEEKKREAVVRKNSAPKKTEDQIRDECMALFTKQMKDKLNIAVNQCKKAGHGASVENFNTTRKFLAPENREKVLSMFPCDDKIKEDIEVSRKKVPKVVPPPQIQTIPIRTVQIGPIVNPPQPTISRPKFLVNFRFIMLHITLRN